VASSTPGGSAWWLGGRIDAAYRAKYFRYPGPVASITAEQARETTLRLDPR
jgi:hypothetical protein